MKFIENVSKEQYIEFYNNFKGPFTQTYEWGQVVGKTRNQPPVYVGMEDDNGKLVAAALLLKKQLPLGISYFYSPRGFMLDFYNEEVLEKFTAFIKAFMKKNKAIYLKIDPEIEYQKIDDKAKPIEGLDNNQKLIDTLINLGYEHSGFVKLHESNQPRYSFYRYFKNYNSEEEIIKSMSKSFVGTVKRSYKYEQTVKYTDDINNFYELMEITSKRDGFINFTKSFYTEFYNVFSKLEKARMHSLVVYPQKCLDNSLKEIEELQYKLDHPENVSKKQLLDIPDIIKRLEKDVAMFSKYVDKVDEEGGITVVTLMAGYTPNGLYTLYMGNNELGLYTFGVNRVYYEAVLDTYRRGYEYMTLLGTIGKLEPKNDPLVKLHDFKRKFGDEYLEFIGEFTLVNNRFLYITLPATLNTIRKVKKTIKKIASKH